MALSQWGEAYALGGEGPLLGRPPHRPRRTAGRTWLARTDRAKGIGARLQGLVAGDDDRAEEHFPTAITRLDNCAARPARGADTSDVRAAAEAGRHSANCGPRTGHLSLDGEAITLLEVEEPQAVREQAQRATDGPLSQQAWRERHIAQLASAGTTLREIAMWRSPGDGRAPGGAGAGRQSSVARSSSGARSWRACSGVTTSRGASFS